jgi:Icc-related predicted phosphoesterase
MTNAGLRGRELALCERWLSALARRYRAVFWVPGNHDIGVRAATFDHLAHNLHCLLDRTLEWESWQLHGVSLATCFDMPHLADEWDYMTADPSRDAAAFDFEPVDIIVSHGPPLGVLDSAGRAMARDRDGSIIWAEVHIGSPALAAAIDRGQPLLVVCGHAHGNPAAPVFRGRSQIHNVAERFEIIRLAP